MTRMRGAWLVVAMVAAAGCGGDDTGGSPPDDVLAPTMTNTTAATGGAGGTAGTAPTTTGTGGTTAGATAGTPAMPVGGTTATPLADAGAAMCFLEVAMDCDGDEDCTGSQVCCGNFDSNAFTYTSITCQDSCLEADSQYKLCHAGETCPDATQECRRSQVIPHDFVTVCAPPANVGTSTGAGAGSGIECGNVTCTGSQKCCLSGTVESGTGLQAIRNALDPYCVASQSECGCGGGGDADAGADDAG